MSLNKPCVPEIVFKTRGSRLVLFPEEDSNAPFYVFECLRHDCLGGDAWVRLWESHPPKPNNKSWRAMEHLCISLHAEHIKRQEQTDAD